MIFTSALFFYAVVSLLINIGGITLCTGSIGCGPVKYFFTMVLPMSKTVVATVSVFTFLNVWNDYLWPSLVFTSSDLLTAQIGLNSKVFLMNEPLSNLYFSFGGAQAVARVSKYEISQIGDTIHFVFMPSKMHFFDKETGVNYTEM